MHVLCPFYILVDTRENSEYMKQEIVAELFITKN